jgi:hypothetical protein
VRCESIVRRRKGGGKSSFKGGSLDRMERKKMKERWREEGRRKTEWEGRRELVDSFISFLLQYQHNSFQGI